MSKFLAILLVLGCAADKSSDTAADSDPSPAAVDPCLPGDAPSLEVGHGELGFESLGDGTARSELIHGPQGGFHNNIAISATGMDGSENWTVEIEGWLGVDLVGHTFPIAKMRCNRAEGALQAWSLLLIWDGVPADLHGQTADILVTVEDTASTTVTAEQSLVIWDPELE